MKPIARTARRKPAVPNTRTIPDLEHWERHRFWRLVERRGPADCWPWLGGTASGYGRFKAHGRLYSAHRVAYTLTKGPIPRGAGYHGTVVMHGCDNPACCNPVHLTAGTHRDNVMDMVRKGRSNAQGYAPGEHPLAKKFSPEVTLAICQSPLSSREAAKVFGVSTHTINRIRRENGCSRPQFVSPSRL